MNSWPAAMPSMHAVSVSCPVEADAPKSRVSAGSPGRYMSIDSGPNADRPPRITINFRPAGIFTSHQMLGQGSPTLLLRCAAVSRLGRSDLDVFGLCLGGNVFGWTADGGQSKTVHVSFRSPNSPSLPVTSK